MTDFISKSGNIFDTTCTVLINPVNCVGIMGKGLAYQFRKKYSNLEKEYKKYCDKPGIKPGKLFSFKTNEKIIICFPTKINWRNPSKYEYIELGLNTLRILIESNGYESVAIPAIGCGLGELEWLIVKEMIIGKLLNINNLIVELYNPLETNCIEE